MAKILMLVSSGSVWTLPDGSPHEVGVFGEEALKPYDRFVISGVEVVVATPEGQMPHLDAYGLEHFFHYPDEDEDFLASITRTFMHDVDDVRVTLQHLTDYDLIAARRVHQALRAEGLSDDEARALLRGHARTAWSQRRNFISLLSADEAVTRHLSPDRLAELRDEVIDDSRAEAARTKERISKLDPFQNPVSLARLTDEQLLAFDAVFIPGGHGAMDLYPNADVRRLLRLFHQADRPVCCLCHGPAALLNAGEGPDGRWLYDGYRMTSFSDEEESQTRLAAELKGVPWWLETELKNAGAVFDDAPTPWAAHVVVDRNLITSSNPMSSDAAAEALLRVIRARQQQAA